MPQRLGRYAVRRRIGSGGFATVWLAYDEHLDSPVAIKVLADNWTEDSHVRRRFVEEGRFLRKVESPHVVSVHDAGELEDGRPYLVMTYADQGTLADRLEQGPLEARQAVEVIRQVGSGLTALHRRGVLHRDVKPGNVLFRSDLPDRDEEAHPHDPAPVRAVLGDLGLGKALDVSSRLTMIAGTPSFVAPEQARGEALDARADQFSLGALTYLVLTGRQPWTHTSLAAAAEPGPPPPLGTPDRPYPRALEDVVARALSADRDDRFPDVRSYVAALVAATADTASTAPRDLHDPDRTQVGLRPSPVPAARPTDVGSPEPLPPDAGPPSRPGRRRWAVLATLGAVLVGAAAAYALVGSTDDLVTVSDSQGTLSVAVPRSWRTTVSGAGWEPPGETLTFRALSVGGAGDEPGVFLGVMPGTRLPADLPGHPECGEAEPEVRDDVAGDRSVTVVHTDCVGGVVVERVIRVTTNRLLWVQVRSPDRATANRVLDGVETHGL